MRKLLLFVLPLVLFGYGCDTESNAPVLNAGPRNLDSLLEIYPDSVALLVERANNYFEAYNYEMSLSDAAKAFRLDSTNLEARLIYAEALASKPGRIMAEVVTAQRHYKSVIKKDPKNTRALVGLASTYTQQQDFDNSFKYLDEALRIDKKYRNAYVMKGTNYRIMGNIDLAKSSYETAVQQDPEFFEAYIVLGSLYQADTNEVCIQYYTTAYQLQPNNMDAVYALAFAKDEFDDHEGARELYRIMAHDTSDFYVERGLFHQGRLKQFVDRDIDSAIYFYNSAVTTDPAYVEAWHNLGMCYEEQGNKTRALQSYAKALKYDPEFKLSREAADKLR